MAKAKTVASRPRGGAVPPPRAERGNYFAEVIQELRKVSWPTRTELVRMTQIVMTTVVIFALLIGAADLLLSIIVKQLYIQPGSTTLGALQQH